MNYLRFIFIFTFLSNIFSYSQNKQTDDVKKITSKQEIPTFTLKMNMNRNTMTIYKFSEVSNVTRTMSDSSTRNFKRESEFYFTLKVPNSPDNGFQTFEISIDSLKYRFTEEGEKYEYDSQSDVQGPITFEDLKNTVIPNGKEFNVTYSPYGEIVKVEGEGLDWLKSYVQVEGKGILDSIQTFIWLDGISKSRLISICDPKKLIFPSYPVAQDSSWISYMEFQTMNITCFDSSKAKIKSINNGVFDIKGNSFKFSSINNPVKFYGFKENLVNIIKSEGNGNYDMIFGPRGLLRSFKLEYNITLFGKVKLELFKDEIYTKQSWEMLNQYKY